LSAAQRHGHALLAYNLTSVMNIIGALMAASQNQKTAHTANSPKF
jgi:hypothetical protein